MKAFGFFLSVILFAIPAGAQSTGTIKGTVSLAEKDLTLPHVTVLVSQLGRSVETGDDGAFEFQNVPPGTYDVVVTRAGLSSLLQSVQVTEGQTATVDFKLSLSPIRQEITVTTTGAEVPTFESFQTVSTLDSFALAEKSAASVGEVLDNQPGVAKRSSGPGTARPVIRGFDGDRVLIMEDGIRTGTLSSQSADHGEPIDVMSIERLEVVKGPATLLYGSNAIGGVVNAVSRHFQMKEQNQDGIRGYLSGTGGTNNKDGAGSTGFELGNNNWLLWANASHQKTQDYKAGGGQVVVNSGARLSNGGIGLGWFGDRAFTSGGYDYSDGIWGIPFAQGADELVRLDFFKRKARLSGGFRTDSPINMFRYDFNYSGYVHKEINFLGEEPELGTTFNNKQYTYQFAADHRAGDRLTGTLGFYGMHRNYLTVGEEAITPPTEGNVVAVFGLEELSFNRFKLQFGGRLEDTRYDPTGAEKTTFTGVSASTGIHVPLWQNGAFVMNYTHSYRAPALEELYNNGPHPGNLVFEVGNPGLDRERGAGIDASLRHVAERIRAEANFYYYNMKDFVFLDVTDEIEDGLPIAFYRQGDTKYTGTELVLNAGLHPNLWLDLGLDYVRAELKDTNTPLPRIPPLRSHIGIEGRYRGLSVKPEVIMADKQDRVFVNEDPTAGYATFNLNASYTLPARHFSHHFAFTAFNLGDRLYRNHLSFIKSIAPEIGRGVKFTYSLRFF
jgi:iron complex outermembrane recepter protein